MTDALREKIIKDVRQYLRENIEDYDERASLAWRNIDHMRCPLRMADYSLESEMENAVEDWLHDNFELEDFL